MNPIIYDLLKENEALLSLDAAKIAEKTLEELADKINSQSALELTQNTLHSAILLTMIKKFDYNQKLIEALR